MRVLFCMIPFFFVCCTIFGQSENTINSILEESLVKYFNIQDSISMKNNAERRVDRYVCMQGFPLSYDFNKNNDMKFHDGTYFSVKKLRKNKTRGISSAYVFLDFQNEYFVVSIVDRYISYPQKNICEIQYTGSIHFTYKYDPDTKGWKCVKQEVVAL